MAGDYKKVQHTYGNRGGSLLVADDAVQSRTILAARNSNNSIFLQWLRVHLTSPGFDGAVWTFTDSTGFPLTGPIPVDSQAFTLGKPCVYDFDFGVDGVALTPGADFVFNPIASDAHATVSWGAYNRLVVSTADNVSTNKE